MKKHSVFIFLLSACLLTACHDEAKKQPRQDEKKTEQVENNDVRSTPMPDFSLPDMNGNPTSAMEYVAKNKITIIDFWASWCGPCRAEMPNVVALYEANKDKGLGIIGVSLDNNAEAWKAAVKEMNMNWLQVSDLKGWDCEAAKLFGIESIPFTLIVNKEGHLLAFNLRGEQLKEFISQKLSE